MAENELQESLMDFERNRVQLLNVSAQKQQLQAQGTTLGAALDELDGTKEKKVYKAVGNILILADVSKVKKELKDQKESVDLRVKTLQKQEDTLIDKLNKLKANIEASQKGAKPAAEAK